MAGQAITTHKFVFPYHRSVCGVNLDALYAFIDTATFDDAQYLVIGKAGKLSGAFGVFTFKIGFLLLKVQSLDDNRLTFPTYEIHEYFDRITNNRLALIGRLSISG